MRPYRLIGKTTRNQIAERFLQVVMTWQKEWCVDIKQSSIDFSSEYSESIALTGFGSKADKSFSLFCIEDHINWPKLVFGSHSDLCPDDFILRGSINDAKNALVYSLVKNLNSSIEPNLQAGELLFESDPGNGNLFLCVHIDDQKLNFWLSSNVVEKFIPVKSKRSELELSRRVDLCMSALASVVVKLNLGRFPIESIQSLTPGDVLSTDVKLDTPLSLEINKTKALPVNLGRVENHKAVIFLPIIK